MTRVTAAVAQPPSWPRRSQASTPRERRDREAAGAASTPRRSAIVPHMSDADDKAGAATGETTPAQGGNTDKEAPVIRRPKHIETKPEHEKRSLGAGQGNKPG